MHENEKLCFANLKKHFLTQKNGSKVFRFLKTIILCELPRQSAISRRETFLIPSRTKNKHFHLHTKMFALENVIFPRFNSCFITELFNFYNALQDICGGIRKRTELGPDNIRNNAAALRKPQE